MNRHALYAGACALALASAPIPALAASVHFGTPSSNGHGWGGWSRGDEGSIHARWEGFGTPGQTGPLPAIRPDAGHIGPGTPALRETTGLGFITSTRNIYSFAAPLYFTVDVPGAAGYGATEVALQTAIMGASVDPGTVLLNGSRPDRTQQIYKGPSGSSFGGDAIVDLWVWELEQSAASYGFFFGARAPSLSLSGVAIDIGASAMSEAVGELPSQAPAPVPLPPAAWLLGAGVAALAGTARRRARPDGGAVG